MSDHDQKQQPLTQAKRSLGDVLAELERERASRELRVLALAVGFEDRTEFVFVGDEACLRKLNKLVMNGGEPIGTFSLDQRGLLEVNPLAEFAGESWAFDYLNDLTASFTQTLEATGMANIAPAEN